MNRPQHIVARLNLLNEQRARIGALENAFLLTDCKESCYLDDLRARLHEDMARLAHEPRCSDCDEFLPEFSEGFRCKECDEKHQTALAESREADYETRLWYSERSGS